MQLQEIIDAWKIDSKIDRDHLDTEQARCANLHSKYLELFAKNNLLLESEKMKQEQIVHTLRQYYRGQLCEEELNKLNRKQPNPKVLKEDLNYYVITDPLYIPIQKNIIIIKEKAAALSEILKQVGNRSFAINNMQKDRKFMSGD